MRSTTLMEEFEMFEKLMRKFGYEKPNKRESEAISIIQDAFLNKQDIFIDYLSRKNIQRVYVKQKGKKAIAIAELEWSI